MPSAAKGKSARPRFLILAGPTREPIDPVRYLSNRSSGKMGVALAAAASKRGRVTLVLGPCPGITAPRITRLIRVETGDEMAAAARRFQRGSDIIIQCAAVADFKVSRPSHRKIKKSRPSLTLKLVRTTDILVELGKRKSPRQVLVGFAAETERLEARARGKLRSKRLDFVVGNLVSLKHSPFGSLFNQVLVLGHDGFKRRYPRMSKPRLAKSLITLFCAEFDRRT